MLEVDHSLGEFFQRTGRLWHDYKSIPNYFEKAAEVMVVIKPDYALSLFKEEIEKKNNNQTTLEKKRILTNLLPSLAEKAIDLMVELMTDSQETFSTRSYALRTADHFDLPVRSEILLKSLQQMVTRHRRPQVELRTEEMLFIQDLMERCVEKISDIHFFLELNKACNNPRLQKLVLEPLVNHLTNPNREPSKQELFHALKIKDNHLFDLRRALAKKNMLELTETNNFVLQRLPEDLTRDVLLTAPSMELLTPIPESLESQYEIIKALFFRNHEAHDYVTSEKIFGGLLITGTEDLEKLYFCRALAKEKSWNFSFIDAALITNKESYANASRILNELRKPYLLYIINPDALYSKVNMEIDVQRAKFVQALAVQAMDNKSFLAGDILVPMEKAKNSELKDKINMVRSKFFPQVFEINRAPHTIKYKIVEDSLKFISSHRFENRKDLCNELYEAGKEMPPLNFIFFTIETIAAMLIVFGKDVPYREISKLETEFKENLKQLKMSHRIEEEFFNEDVNQELQM